jgi:hypothetical protein
MKSFTDLEQSKKLSSILRLTSADMFYSYDYMIDELEEDPMVIPKSELGQHFSLFPEDIPCWSLAVLLSILPNIKLCHYGDSYFCQYMDRGDEFPTYSTNEYNNPVDACVEMILKLHELNLL